MTSQFIKDEEMIIVPRLGEYNIENSIGYQFLKQRGFVHPFPKDRKKIRDKLYEGLIRTYSIDDTIDMLERNGIIYGRNIDVNTLNDTYKILIIITNDDEELVNLINSRMDAYGWQLANKGYEDDGNIISLLFKAKFDIEIKNQKRFIFYHATPTVFLTRILRIGLIPKALNKLANLGDRIYFYTQRDWETIESLISNLFLKNKMDYQYKKDYTLLQIAIGKTDPKVRLFLDPDGEDAVYTMENIEPEFIKPIKSYQLNKRGKITNVQKI
jgi:hypothetical protein